MARPPACAALSRDGLPHTPARTRGRPCSGSAAARLLRRRSETGAMHFRSPKGADYQGTSRNGLHDSQRPRGRLRRPCASAAREPGGEAARKPPRYRRPGRAAAASGAAAPPAPRQPSSPERPRAPATFAFFFVGGACTTSKGVDIVARCPKRQRGRATNRTEAHMTYHSITQARAQRSATPTARVA
jgi:hypothetical protein